MFKKIILSTTFILSSHFAFSQGVAINEDNTSANASAILDIKSINKGLLIPRMTEAQKIAITTPAIGLLIYQTDGTTGFYYHNGTVWTFINPIGLTGATGAAGQGVPTGGTAGQTLTKVDGTDYNTQWTTASASAGWGLTGNTSTVEATNFIGTTDNKALQFRVNNITAGYISRDGWRDNTSFGYASLPSTTTGFSNVAIGAYALQSNTQGSNNIAIGVSALQYNIQGRNNIATGNNTLRHNTTGESNVAIGNNTLGYNDIGNYNVATGDQALFQNSGGNNNVATGSKALKTNATGSYNVATGSEALFSNTIGSNNIAIGANALYGNTTGSNNVVHGYQSLQTGNYDNVVAIGANISMPTDRYNVIAIGTGITSANITQSNMIRLGNFSITKAEIQVAWNVTSDRRWKNTIQNSDLGLNFITSLRPVSYLRNNDESQKIEYGFIAQELEEALTQAGVKNGGIISKNNEGMLSVRYNDLFAPLVKSIQELKAENDALKAANEKLNAKINEIDILKAELEQIKEALQLKVSKE